MAERSQICIFCGGNASEPDHLSTCDGRQGGRDDDPDPIPRPRPARFESVYEWWPHEWRRDNPMFDGLRDELKDVICDTTITVEMMRDLWDALADGAWHYAHELIARFEFAPWWKPGTARSTKERFLRKILDTAVARGYPLCSGNLGYAIADADMLREAAKRERALERGAGDKADAFERLAAWLDRPPRGRRRAS